jgi:hypothetical protein
MPAVRPFLAVVVLIGCVFLSGRRGSPSVAAAREAAEIKDYDSSMEIARKISHHRLLGRRGWLDYRTTVCDCGMR